MNISDLKKLLEDTQDKSSVYGIINSSTDDVKIQILLDGGFIEKLNLMDYQLKELILSMSPDKVKQILENITLVKEKFKLSNWQISALIKAIDDEDEKIRMCDLYNIEGTLIADIATSFSTAKKIELILRENFNNYERIGIMTLLGTEEIIEFLESNKQFCLEHNIAPYEVVRELDSEGQQQFAQHILTMDLETSEKREVIAILDDEAKQKLDVTNYPEELKDAIQIKSRKFGIVVELNGNLERYRGLDRLMSIKGNDLTEEERKELIELCKICPNMGIDSVLNRVVGFSSSGREYIEGEEWISSIINGLDSKLSDAQKLAIIDNAIGKKVSYSPDFETEVSDPNDCRALWKIISTGYGVCNGIANLEKYMLDRIGIQSEVISGVNHAFLKIKDIELPLASGENVKGDTILDPTWNLTTHRFGGRPSHFCLTYEEARKGDIDEEGKDHQSHKNDEKLQDVTLGLDDKSLRALFTSVGLANKDGSFPIKSLIDASKDIGATYANEPNKNINMQLALLKKFCPEFATCQNSTMGILSMILNDESLQFDKCVVNRVYDKTDEDKRPILYVYISSNELGRKFYFADKETRDFIELPEEQFKSKFECYEADLKKNKGLRPWENSDKTRENINLSTSSGKVVAEEGR